MAKLWQKKSSAKDERISKAVEQFTVGKDYILDQKLVPYDVWASKVHAEGLQKIGVLTKDELKKIHAALDKVTAQWQDGKFEIRTEDEDCHTAIENFVVKKLGNLGKKIHTGRSRNDQVLVAMRLYERESLDQIIEKTVDLAQLFITFAKEYEQVPMPGYTHTQKAMLASVGMWAGSFAEMLIFNLNTLAAVYKNVNLSPLGSAAGFGVNFDLPREYTAEALGFAAPITISLTAQNTRGKIEADLMSAIVSLAGTLAHFANDLILFTSREFDFFEPHDSLCTGSSIMPQKKNLDSAEVLRGRYSEMLGFESTLRTVTHNLISGYHRDLQYSKEPVMRGIESIDEMIEMAMLLVENIKPKEENLRSECTPELFAADAANALVKNGHTFRDAYREIGENLDKLEEVDLDENLHSKKHLGATGNLGLEILKKKLQNFNMNHEQE